MRMRTRLTVLGIWRITMAFLAVGAAIVLAGCPRAAAVPTGISFGTGNLTVAVVPTLTAGMPMTAVTLPEAMAGSETLTYRVTPMVPGLAFDPATRVLSGTPTVSGSYSLTYTATTSDGTREASLKFIVEVQSSFMGTWSASRDWWGDDGVVGTFTDTLTFTKGRYIVHRAYYRTGSTSVEFDSWWSGTWEAKDATVTRIWLHDHDDDHETPRVERRVRKGYVWSEDRTVLCMQHWMDDEEGLDDPYCERHQRVIPPVPADLLGTWTGSAGDNRRFGYTFVLTADEFTVDLVDTEVESTFTLTGSYVVDQEELSILVTVTDVLEDGTSILGTNERWERGMVSRWAFAPTDSPTRLFVSIHWWELRWDADAQQWFDNPDYPYGDYFLGLEKR